jgi:carboxyl-terminal processing protease
MCGGEQTNTARDFEVTGAIVGGIGYVALPGYNGQNAERSAAFAAAIQRYIAEAQAAHACRWIVDLRNDIGGNMYPMLAGLHPLLGDQPLGYFYNRAGEWIPWSAHGSGSNIPDSSFQAVAVITGPKTASAGEAVTLSFRGRPHTRSFGAQTGGYSTANQAVALSDGARIALTTGLMADRFRNIAEGSIPPDEAVEVPNAVRLNADPAIAAATAWLMSQACLKSPRHAATP